MSKEQDGIAKGAMKTLEDMTDVLQTHQSVVGQLPQEQLENVINQLTQERRLIDDGVRKAYENYENRHLQEQEVRTLSRLRLDYLKVQQSFIYILLSTAQKSYNARFLN